MQPRIKRALDRFEEAVSEYAFRGTHSHARVVEITDEYHAAMAALHAVIEKALKEAFNDGSDDADSRARNRPGDGDMGG